MFQAGECVELCQRIKESTGKSLWCYTGFTWEEIHSHGSREMVQLAEMVDVLVDGRFVMALRDTDLLFASCGILYHAGLMSGDDC